MVNMEQSTTRPGNVEDAARNVAALFEGVAGSELHKAPPYINASQLIPPVSEAQVVPVQEVAVLPPTRREDPLLTETSVWSNVESRRRQALDGLAT